MSGSSGGLMLPHSLPLALHLLKSVNLTKIRQGTQEPRVQPIRKLETGKCLSKWVYSVSAGANNWLLIHGAATNVRIASLEHVWYESLSAWAGSSVESSRGPKFHCQSGKCSILYRDASGFQLLLHVLDI